MNRRNTKMIAKKIRVKAREKKGALNSKKLGAWPFEWI